VKCELKHLVSHEPIKVTCSESLDLTKREFVSCLLDVSDRESLDDVKFKILNCDLLIRGAILIDLSTLDVSPKTEAVHALCDVDDERFSESCDLFVDVSCDKAFSLCGVCVVCVVWRGLFLLHYSIDKGLQS